MRIASLETTARRSSRANSRGSEPCSASEYVSRVIPENDVVAAPSEDEDAGDPDRDLERVATMVGSGPSKAAAIPTSGSSSHCSPRAVCPPETG